MIGLHPNNEFSLIPTAVSSESLLESLLECKLDYRRIAYHCLASLCWLKSFCLIIISWLIGVSDCEWLWVIRIYPELLFMFEHQYEHEYSSVNYIHWIFTGKLEAITDSASFAGKFSWQVSAKALKLSSSTNGTLDGELFGSRNQLTANRDLANTWNCFACKQRSPCSGLRSGAAIFTASEAFHSLRSFSKPPMLSIESVDFRSLQCLIKQANSLLERTA